MFKVLVVQNRNHDAEWIWMRKKYNVDVFCCDDVCGYFFGALMC